MKELIEVKIGEIVKIGDESYICVKDDTETLCSDCAFYGEICCCRYICSSINRKDKYNVHFVEQEGGEKTREPFTRKLYLKIKSEYFEAVKSGKKTFEVRRNDRGFKVGDIVVLREIEAIDAHGNYQFTGRRIKIEITYILDDAEYCKPGFVVFSFKIIGPEEGGKE